ncbi:hypothetical protein DY000_02059361 [Brassica cretica]|uniref:Uncharacterized protein n=1 Tax=Brassica cretica TaxID=69181 RepID=A0ABQ7ATL1_BRACR|nr:hypothetical protein DY000_02059361 [Brassica cretica]
MPNKSLRLSLFEKPLQQRSQNNVTESRASRTALQTARGVLAGGAAAKSEALKEEVLATGLLEDNPLAECNQKHNNDSSYGTHGIMVTLRIESLFDGLLHSMENRRATGQITKFY